nr:MAG TPA: hypothetical protein [Ackermannviridae sp.]DAW82318.1 MAG TPA: hypothetical protein [Bacteriophage sp.]
MKSHSLQIFILHSNYNIRTKLCQAILLNN